MNDFYGNTNKVDKIKVTKRIIIVTGNNENPYYEINFWTLDGEEHIGYGSYDLKNVFEWLDDCFEIVV